MIMIEQLYYTDPTCFGKATLSIEEFALYQFFILRPDGSEIPRNFWLCFMFADKIPMISVVVLKRHLDLYVHMLGGLLDQ